MKFVYLLPLLTLFAIPAFASSDNYCLDQLHKGIICYSYLQSSVGQSPSGTLGWTMDIIAPNNTCNIFGNITPQGACTYHSIVLTNDDFNLLKQNPSVLAVINIQNSAMTAQDYCPVAQWTWDSQDQAFKDKYASMKNLVVPDKCNPQPIPEFPLVPSLILVVAVSAIVVLGRQFVLKSPLSEI